MKKCAIILNGSDVVKVSNLKRKYNKFINNPDIKILEECDENQLEDKYNYWCQTINYKAPEQEEENPLKYHWRNKITGYTHHSIYPHMNNIPDINPEEWEPYDENPNGTITYRIRHKDICVQETVSRTMLEYIKK